MRRENCEGERKDIWKSRSIKCDEKKDGIGRKEKQRRDKNECKKKKNRICKIKKEDKLFKKERGQQ